MKFAGIYGITPERFNKIIQEHISWGDSDEIMPELKKFISYKRYGHFVKKFNYKPEGGVEYIINKAIAEVKQDEESGYIKISDFGGWYIYLKADGTIDTNIALNKPDWTGLEDIWVGLNSAAGKKKDGTIIQAGSDDLLCGYKNVKAVVTRTYLDKKEWAVQLDNGVWEYHDGNKISRFKSVCLDESTGELIKE